MGKVHMQVEYEGNRYYGFAANTDIIAASVEAFIDAINKFVKWIDNYPLMLETSTSIYALTFVEAGNAWHDVNKFNPFELKRSAGVGVRIFLPMIGMMGIDWAYGFDKIMGSSQYGGSQFHFILGQEF